MPVMANELAGYHRWRLMAPTSDARPDDPPSTETADSEPGPDTEGRPLHRLL